MELALDFEGFWQSETVDLKELYDLAWVLDEDDMHLALKVHIAGLAIKRGVAFNEVEPGYIKGEAYDELSVSTFGGPWIMEVAKLVWHVYSMSQDADMYLAYIDNVGWKFFDFDDLDQIDDKYSREFDGDLDAFGREHYEEVNGRITDAIDRYFDFERYAEEMVEEYSSIEWGTTTYLFSE